MTDYVPIDCGLHDHLELACMRRARLRLHTADGTLQGRAVTTRTDTDHAEWLILEQAGGETRVRLDRIERLVALDDSAGFDTLDFRRD